MYIAVANMTKPNDLELRIIFANHSFHRSKKFWDAGNHCGYIVFIRRPARNGFRNILPQTPQRLCLSKALTHHAIENPTLLHAMFEQGHCLLHDLFIPLFKLQQRVKFCRCFERALQALMLDDFLQR